MKSVMVLWCFVVAIFVLLALGLAFMVQQQQANAVAVRDVLGKVATYDLALNKIDAAVKTHEGDIKVMQGALTDAMSDAKGLDEKVASLVQQVNEVKAQLQGAVNAGEAGATPAPDLGAGATTSSVELGTIPVQK